MKPHLEKISRRRASLGRGRIAAALLVALAGGATASAQNALGDGRALDKNQQKGSAGRNAPGRDFAAEAYFKNSIVTGNAANGLSFRGFVGYTAPDDFRQALPSNQQFSFQRDSLYSAFGAQGLRGVDALQQQMLYTTGNATATQSPLPVVRRAGNGTSSGMVEGAGELGSGTHATQTFNPWTLRMGGLRSTSEFQGNRSLAPRILLDPTLGEAAAYAVASPLRGVTPQRTPDYVRPLPANLITLEAQPNDATNRLPSDKTSERAGSGLVTHDEILDQLNRNFQEGADKQGSKKDKSVDRDFPSSRDKDSKDSTDNATDKADKSDPKNAADAAKAKTIEESRPGAQRVRPSGLEDSPSEKRAKDSLHSGETPSDAADKDAGIATNPDTGRTEYEAKVEGLTKRLRTPSAPGVSGKTGDTSSKPETEQERREALMHEAEALFGGVNPKVMRLSPPPGSERDLFAEQMREGESLLAAKRWFESEERFSAALRLKPGDPMAAAGRINAQLGAAMFLSASSNLRELLRTHPEMMSVVYDPSLLPNAERLAQVRAELRENATHDTPSGRDAGFLLAYLGHQFGDIKDVRDGMNAVERITTAMSEPPDPLFDAVRAVWVAMPGQETPFTREHPPAAR